jgi:3-deoxy-7-phosphoheptulonate synthase
MGYKRVSRIPDADEIKSEIPASARVKDIVSSRISEIESVLLRKNNRLIVIIGPCSVHDEEAVFEWLGKLSLVNEELSDRLLLIPRVYTNKPRTTGVGFKGMAHQPNLDNKPDLEEGIRRVRKMHIRYLEEFGMPAAEEMLYPRLYPYLEDLLGYVAVGARSTTNQDHRLASSALNCPVGIKNALEGGIETALDAIYAAQKPHHYMMGNYFVDTDGNQFSHLILRGEYIASMGRHIPNYEIDDILRFKKLYESSAVVNPAIIVDCSHSNARKRFKKQISIAEEVVSSVSASGGLIKGLMIESFLREGSQKISENMIYGKSVTDPCLGWDDSVELLRRLADLVK